jgi:hypothetical protein
MQTDVLWQHRPSVWCDRMTVVIVCRACVVAGELGVEEPQAWDAEHQEALQHHLSHAER